jgi:hypothetical protein
LLAGIRLAFEDVGCSARFDARGYVVAIWYCGIKDDYFPKGLAIKYNPSYDRKVGNKKSDMSGCDLCDWNARNDLE